MNLNEQNRALTTAIGAAREVGALMKRNLLLPKKINETHAHDIKLDLDVRCQIMIEKRLTSAFPEVAVLGEEGIVGDPKAADRWVVDPIDGTVNFTYGIPHACVSIALQKKLELKKEPKHPDEQYQTLVGIVYDPFTDELFSAIRGQPAKLNGKRIAVSKRAGLDEAIVSVGFAKTAETVENMLPQFNQLVHKVRKIRIMGAAAMAMIYVAAGRFDAYIEGGVRLWDIAAGGLILECAGGDFWFEPIEGEHAYKIIANNGLLRKKLMAIGKK